MNNEQTQDLRERWQKLRTDAVSEMFETGPDKDGIYRTTALYKKLDAAFDILAAEVAGEKEKELRGIKIQRQHDMLLAEASVRQIAELEARISELEQEVKALKQEIDDCDNIIKGL